MKKIFIAASAAAVMCMGAYTASAQNVGDVIGAVAYSNLNTYINNYPINAYYRNGRQLICAEDLSNYGFTVEWNEAERSLYITPDYSTTEIQYNTDIKNEVYLQYKRAYDVCYTDIGAFLNGERIESCSIDGRLMIPIRALETLGHCEYSAEENYSKAFIDGLPVAEYKPIELSYDKRLTVVLDAGHGKDSGNMSDEEKIAEGYYYNGMWGEWRHWKNGTANEECFGSGCHGDRSCWYPMGNGDRDTEPEINLRNAMAARNYLENELGYYVRMTRESNDQNPSFSKRVSYCYPNNDLGAEPDASAYICIHSNAGGGRGSAYIAAEGNYTQKWIKSSYVSDSNRLGAIINDRIVNETSMPRHGDGIIGGEGYLILFNKAPVPAGYIEIGFFDNYSDLSILNSEYDAIGRAIALGVNDFLNYTDE